MIHGILLVDKPEGPSSNQVVQKIRRMVGSKKVGHAGTLDPFATGLLVAICGDATKIARYLNEEDKIYKAFCEWGKATDTGDVTGKVVRETKTPLPSSDEIRKAMDHFSGEILQIPPMFSAKKINGRPLYINARKGNVVGRKPVKIKIHSIELLEETKNGFHFEVHCSKGTYVRTLAEDICRFLDGEGHLSSLRRTQCGNFKIEQAHVTSELLQLTEENCLDRAMISVEDFCLRFPAVVLNDEAVVKMEFGHIPKPNQLVRIDPFLSDAPVRFLDMEGRLLALARPLFDPKAGFKSEQEKKAFKIEYNFSARKPVKKMP